MRWNVVFTHHTTQLCRQRDQTTIHETVNQSSPIAISIDSISLRLKRVAMMFVCWFVRAVAAPASTKKKKGCGVFSCSENKQDTVLLFATGGRRCTGLLVEMLGVRDHGIVGQLELVLETRANRQHALLVTCIASPHRNLVLVLNTTHTDNNATNLQKKKKKTA
jgi:hypothetical protein